MSAEARAARKKNFQMPTATELQEMQKLEAEREGRRAQRALRAQNRDGMELNRASICANLVIQLPAAIDSNKTLIDKARKFLEPYLDKAFTQLQEPPESDDKEEPEPEPEPEPKAASA
jgi:hypothetical protein